MPRFRPAPEFAWLALLIGVTAAAYANSFAGAFQFDDFRVIVDYPPVHSWQGWWTDLGGGLRPLLKLTYLGCWLLGAGETWPFHLANLAIHLACSGLVYGLALAFGQSVRPDHDWRPVAYFTAVLFALHPAHTEAVTYISGRSSSLMTMFYLAALLSYHRSTIAAATKWRAAALGLFGLAVLAKESALCFPLALLVWEWAQRTPWRTVATRQWPFWIVTAALAAAALLHSGYSHLLSESFQQRSLLDGVASQLHGAVGLIGKLLWPMALNIDPDLPTSYRLRFFLPEFFGLLLTLTLAWRARRARPWLSLAVAWVFVHLLAYNALLPRVDVANERQLYWADWPLFLALVAGVEERWSERWRSVLALLATGLVLVTVARNAVYESEIALWRDTVTKSPGKARAHNNLGYAYDLAGRQGEALQAYQRALEIDPDYLKARNNIERSGADGTIGR